MKLRLALLIAMMLVVPTWVSQYQPTQTPDWDAYEARSDLSEADGLDEAERVLRFVQVSDAHIIDDDAPEPMRVGFTDPLGDPFTSAERPQEEYTDEVLDAMIRSINAHHAEDPFDFVINTGDNIDNQLENELLRFMDNWEGTFTTKGPVSGLECAEDGQSENLEDDSNDVTEQCTYLPPALQANNTALAFGLPWFSAFGNHDGLIQGNVPREPSFQELAAEYGRYFLDQDEYVDMHFRDGQRCLDGAPAGSVADDFGHGFAFAGQRLCDESVDNDGYYAFSTRGVRFLVLDTVNDDFVTGNEHLAGMFVPQEQVGYDVMGGYAEGAIDPVQFDWMMREIERNPDELIVLMSHHTVNSMFSSQTEGNCQGDMCLDDLLTAAGYATGPQLVENLTQHPNVVAWIGGHTHKHRIETKSIEGAPSPGFWNIETSSLIDLPQQARAIELWTTGDQAFLRLDSIDHDFELSRDLAGQDPQADPAAAGDADDQEVLLWFDVPAQVALSPQAKIPRYLSFDVVAPERINGTHGEVGDEIKVVVSLQDSRFGTGVEGLEVEASIERSDPHDPTGVVSVNATPVSDLGDGRYGLSFVPDAPYVHFVKLRIEDPVGTYPSLDRVASIDIGGDVEETQSTKKSPAAAWSVALLSIVAVAAMRRR